MGRRTRSSHAGLHHVSNRGVGLRDIFNNHDDKAFFVSTLCKLSMSYEFTIHSFAIITNGYNILIETNRSNLSLIMQILNTRYSYYFNKKYGRRGHLWENRFRSWYIKDSTFLLTIIAYIEYLPIYTDATTSQEKYLYSSYRQFVGLDERLACLDGSIIFKVFNSAKEIKDFFKEKVDLQKINSLHSSFNNNHSMPKNRSQKKLEIYFDGIISKEQRNQQVLKAYNDEYSQAKIAKQIGLSQQAVHKIIQKQIGSKNSIL